MLKKRFTIQNQSNKTQKHGNPTTTTTSQQPNRQYQTKQTLTWLGNLGAQAFPKQSQATYKKPIPKPNSQPKNPKNNPNTKQQSTPKDPANLGIELPKPTQLNPYKKIKLFYFISLQPLC